MKTNKKIVTLGIVVLSLLFNNLNNEAQANWGRNSNGTWFFVEKDGTLAKNKWKGNYYFGNDGIMLVNTWTPDGRYVDVNGKLVKGKRQESNINNQYKNKPKVNTNNYVKYYGQDDNRWANKVYGLGNLYNTGCVPASLSMILSTYLDRDILVPEVATKLYNETNYFNKKVIGTYAEGIPYITKSYGLKHKIVYTKEELKEELIKGNIVYSAVDNKPFTVSGYSHAVVLRGIDEYGNTTVYNPHSSFIPVRKYSIDKIWEHRSQDPDNLGLGSPIISIYK